MTHVANIGPTVTMKITVEKFDGDPPKPGESKKPIETIVREETVPLSKVKGIIDELNQRRP